MKTEAASMLKEILKEVRIFAGSGVNLTSYATLTETIRAVNADALAAVLGRVALRCEDNATEQHHIAIDGKTIRASKDGEGRAIHCVSAFCQALQQVADHTASRGKGMAIPDALKLLERIDLKDKIVTGGAMFCQEAIAEKITEGGGNYILRVKKNQKNLLNEVQMAFAEPVFPPRTLA